MLTVTLIALAAVLGISLGLVVLAQHDAYRGLNVVSWVFCTLGIIAMALPLPMYFMWENLTPMWLALAWIGAALLMGVGSLIHEWVSRNEPLPYWHNKYDEAVNRFVEKYQ